MKFKIGDEFCTLKNSTRRFRIIDVGENTYTFVVINHDQINRFPIGKVFIYSQESLSKDKCRRITKLDRALS